METLSILIPVFNWDCSRLLADLHSQGAALGIPFEIIVADDCSTDKEAVGINRTATARLEFCRMIELKENIGRASIRNLLADESRHAKLLFMDCDAAVGSSSFLKDYLSVACRAAVVCGGVRHPDIIPEPGVELRWKYEKKADLMRSAEIRGRNPYSRFTPFSFLIDRELFMKIRFDESFREYGYEDVLFGRQLEHEGVKILHIDNPLIHLGLEQNEVFLAKTEQAVHNAFQHRDRIDDSSTLLKHYKRLSKWRMRWFFRLHFHIWGRLMKQNLTGRNPGLKVFSFYKLCYICSLK